MQTTKARTRRRATLTLDPRPVVRVARRSVEPADVLVGRYVLVAELGRGGMGTVFQAHDLDLGRDVAVKIVLAEEAARRPEAEIRLMREARALAQLSHPNVVAVYDVGVVDDHAFLAMELIRGTTLCEWARAQTWQAIARVLVDAGRGLAAAHAAGLVHRDVKPDNILVDHFGRARIIDFGIAEPVMAGFARGSGRRGTGTPEYMAPEVRRGDAPTVASDQYSLFVSLFEALTGGLPPARRARVPIRLRSAIERGLSEDPAHRFPSVWCAADAIERAMRSWW